MAWMEARGFHVTGVDVSARNAGTRRATLVQGELLHMDMCDLTFPPRLLKGSGVTPPYSIFQRLRHQGTGPDASCADPWSRLYLGIQEGDGERWEVDQVWVERFFARYTSEEAEALLLRPVFHDERQSDKTGPRLWLNFLARATD